MPISKTSGIGISQTWQNVSASRSSAVTYYNTTGKPIMVSVQAGPNGGSSTAITLAVDGLSVAGFTSVPTGLYPTVCAIVPLNSSYSATVNSGNIGAWYELR